MVRRRGFFFGDIHFPFHHPVILAIAMYLAIRGKYSYFCQVGDLFDWYSAAKFPRSQNVFTPKQEKQWSRYYAELFWNTLRENCPEVEMHQIRGNHDVRPEKRVMDKAAEFEDDIETSMKRHYTFDGVKTVHDGREELYIDDLCIVHGYYAGTGDRHTMFNLKNVIHGHTHRGYTQFTRINGHDGGCFFEADTGYLADPHSRGLSYTVQKRATRWTWGALSVDEWGPKFVPLHPSMAKWFEHDRLFQDLVAMFTYSRPS